MDKVMGVLFERGRFIGSTTAKLYPTKNRLDVMKTLGGATRVHVQVRVYDRSSSGTPSIDFDVTAGCFGEEPPGSEPSAKQQVDLAGRCVPAVTAALSAEQNV